MEIGSLERCNQQLYTTETGKESKVKQLLQQEHETHILDLVQCSHSFEVVALHAENLVCTEEDVRNTDNECISSPSIRLQTSYECANHVVASMNN